MGRKCDGIRRAGRAEREGGGREGVDGAEDGGVKRMSF